jgi:hypothetical protein
MLVRIHIDPGRRYIKTKRPRRIFLSMVLILPTRKPPTDGKTLRRLREEEEEMAMENPPGNNFFYPGDKASPLLPTPPPPPQYHPANQ